MNAAHEDLVGHVISVGADCLSGECVSGGAYGRTDPDGHGTFVASIIGATTGNARGIAGAATGAPILSVRTLRAEGSGDNFSASAAIYYVVDHGAHVINMSFWGDRNVRSSMITVAVAYAISHDVTVVAAAGNNGDTGDARLRCIPRTPRASSPPTSTDPDDSRSNFSNYGGWLDGKGLSAPGVQICGARRKWRLSAEAGTSFSSPLVAAAAALSRGGRRSTRRGVHDVVRPGRGDRRNARNLEQCTAPQSAPGGASGAGSDDHGVSTRRRRRYRHPGG